MPGTKDDIEDDVEDRLAGWIVAMFQALGIGQPTAGAEVSGKETPEKGPEGPLEERRAALAGRLDSIRFPNTLPSEDRLKIDGQMASIRTVLVNAKAAGDLDRVDAAIAKFEVIAAAKQADAERRAAGVALLSKALNGLAAPDPTYLSVTERPDIEGERLPILRDLSGPIGDVGLKAAEEAVRALIGKVNIARLLSQGRAERSRIALAGFAQVQRPSGGEAAEYQAYEALILPIQALQTPPVDDKMVAAAEAALAQLRSEATRIGDVLAKRKGRADTVRLAIVAKPPDAANAAEIADLGKLEVDCLAALGLPDVTPVEGKLAQAEALLKDRNARLAEIVKAIEERVKLRQTVKAALDKVDLAGIAAEQGLVALQGEAGAIGIALPLADDSVALEALSGRATKLAVDAEAARVMRGEAVLAGLLLNPLTAGLPVPEETPLKDMIDAIRKGATPPLTGAGLIKAADDLTKLPKLLQDAAATVADRKLRVDDAAKAAALVPDPKDANDAEKAALKLLRDHADLAPVPPLTEAMALAAVAALKALNDRDAKLVIEIAAREKLRTETLDRLLLLVPPMSAKGPEAVDVLKVGGTLHKTVTDAKTLKEIQDTDAEIELLKKKIKDIADLALARDVATKALAVAQGEIKASGAKMNTGCFNAAQKLGKDAAVLVDTATKVSDYTAAVVKIADIKPFLVKAETYLTDMQQWRFDAELYLAGMPKATLTQTAQKAAMTAWRDALLVAADLLADQGKITEAKDKLAEFRTGKTTFVDPADSVVKDVQLNAATDTAAKDFAAKIATFAATDLPILRLVEKLGLPQPNPKFQPKYEAAKKKGYETQTWVDAKSDLAALAVTLQSYKPVVEAYQKLVPVLAVPAVATAVTLMKSDLTGGWNYVAALGRLNALAATVKESAEYETKRAALTRRVNGTVAQLAGPAQGRIKGPWDAAPGEPDHAKKMLKLGEAEGLLAGADAMILAREAARAQKARLDAGDVYGLMTDAVAKEGADTFANAKIAYDQAVLGFGRLAILLGKVEKLVAVKDGLAKTAVVALKTITDALAAADIKAKGRLWDDADVALAPAMALPLVQSVSSQIGLYLEARKPMEKRQVRLASAIADPVAKKAFEDPWNAAIAKADTDHDYVKATELIEAHKPVMAEVQAYAGAATRARKGLASMKRIETQALPAARKAGKRALLAITPLANAGQITVAEDAAALAKTNAIYPMPNSKAKLDNDLSLAEVEAGKGNFTAAKLLFEAICLAAKVGMAAAAAEIEALDDGHYVEAHGPGVTDPQHKLRLTTGMRPDGKKVATTNTSQFGDVEDMLAAREVAVAELAVKHPATTGVSVSAGDNLEYVEISEFEVPVGKSFKSDCMKKEFKAGEFKESDLCENYREYGPLTRVFTKMIFLFDDPDTARPSPRRITSFVDVNKHRVTVGGVFPAAYPGRWAVHQHYPTPDNFDPDKGEYVD